MKLTVIGSAALDSIETSRAAHRDILGGSSVYASMSASFFTPVNLISIVGSDFPKRHSEMLRSRNVDLSGLEVKEGRTFRWKARYDKELSYARTLRTELNVFEGFRPLVPQIVSRKDNLLLANIDPELQSYIFHRIKPNGIVACDTMNLWIEIRRKELLKLLKKVDIFLLNDAEARQLSGEKDLFLAAKYILSKGANMLIIKKGENGSLLFSKELSFLTPAYPVKKVSDPTGAGDTFAGAMLGYITGRKKMSPEVLRRAIVYGSIMASFAVERFSAEGLARVTRADVKARYERFKKLTRF
ncbi:MAG: PfkB family carbohydrate kinase [Candidatus Omnitrophota bacterium]